MSVRWLKIDFKEFEADLSYQWERYLTIRDRGEVPRTKFSFYYYSRYKFFLTTIYFHSFDIMSPFRRIINRDRYKIFMNYIKIEDLWQTTGRIEVKKKFMINLLKPADLIVHRQRFVNTPPHKISIPIHSASTRVRGFDERTEGSRR